MRLEKLMETQKQHGNMLRKILAGRINDDVPEDFEDLVKEPINNVAAMDQLNADLEDRGFRRRMVNVYTSFWIKSTWSRCVYWHY